MIAALLGMKIHVSSEKFHCLFISDLVYFIDELIKSTIDKDSCGDPDFSSCSTELSDTEVEESLNLDGHDDKKEEMEKMISEEEIVAIEIDASS